MRIGIYRQDHLSNSWRWSSYNNLDSDWRKRIIPDWWHSSDNWKTNKNNSEWTKSKKDENERTAYKRLNRNSSIEEWIDDYYDKSKIVDYYDFDEENDTHEEDVNSEMNVNPKDYIIEVEWKVTNVLEYNNDWWVSSIKAGKFWRLAISNEIGINQKEKDIRFFNLLNRNWKLFLLDPNYELNWKSLLKVKLSNWESETMPAWIFLKYLWEKTDSRLDFKFDYLIDKYGINWDNNSGAKKYSDINYFGWNTRIAA